MADLFRPDRHEPLAEIPWDESVVRAAICDIVEDAVSHFDPENLWPVHPGDETPFPVAGLYMGAAGVIWALDHLKRVGAADYDFDFRAVLPALAERDNVWLKQMPLGAYGSLLMSDLGPLLLAMRLAPDAATAERIFARCEDNNELPLLDLLWGTPGSMLACLFMRDATGEVRFEQLYREQAARLLAGLEDIGGCEGWTVEVMGRRLRHLGLVHGFAGHMLALIRGWHWLDAGQQRRVAAVGVHTLSATTRRAGGLANWPTDLLLPDEALFCQICRGAPGIVAAFAEAPFSTPELATLLTDAGNLIWAAGPLKKGSGFCHGTGGNGHVLLRLHARTGDAVWLVRARAFAMSAIGQWRAARTQSGRGRYSLWTGDPGLAICLWDCIGGKPAFPGLDFL